jgi:hypothetical protein
MAHNKSRDLSLELAAHFIVPLPPLPVDGRAEPLNIHLDLNVESVELAIERLVELRKQMKPAPA